MPLAVPLIIETPRQLSALRGHPIAVGQDILITQQQIDAFCAISGDHQRIHQQFGAAQQSVVPGNLLVALIPSFIQGAFTVQRYSKCITARYRGIRFLHPVLTGERITMLLTIDKVNSRGDQTRVEITCDLKRGALSVMQASVCDLYYS